MKYQWSYSKVKEFAEKLDRLRSSLTLATVLACHSSTAEDNAEILAHVKEIQRGHQDSRHEVYNVFLSEAVSNGITDGAQGSTSESFPGLQNEVQSCIRELLALRRAISSHQDGQSREFEILRWLDFRQALWRYDEVEKAYDRTYRWIFEDSENHKEWDDFCGHLRSDTIHPYFINGKAGSGKSTLMKHIYGHKKTNTCLREWAGNTEPLKLHYFFWNIGTTLQKSYSGMLRAFLHTVLDLHPELIPAVLPKQYHNWQGLATDSIEAQPTYVELKKAFEIMIERCHYLKLAIFVDGIDEFEGDHRDMSLFLRSLSSNRVKVVISSRPLNSCLEAFADCPTLRLQHVTREDMLVFVQGELSNHHLMIRLEQNFPDTAPQLVIDIIHKAEGVFLWVKLVVRLLIHGLENGDILEELQAKLDALPCDLRDLYKRMFGRLGLEYQKQSALLFRLKEQWSDTAPDHALPGAVLWYAVNSPLTVHQQPLGCIPGSTYNFNMCSLAKRIQSRCCGLLELRHAQKRLDGSFDFEALWPSASLTQVEEVTVSYLHRTVQEFITWEEIWQDICALTNDSEYSIRGRLISACISITKLAPDLHNHASMWYVDTTTHLCREIVETQPQAVYEYLMDMECTFSAIHARAKLSRNKSTISDAEYTQHWSSNSYRVPFEISGAVRPNHISTSIYTYAANRGLFFHLLSVPGDMSQLSRCALVIHALSSWLERTDSPQRAPSIAHRSRTMEQLLTTVINPEAKICYSSLWREALKVCDMIKTQGRLLEVAMLLRIFLSTAQCPWSLWRQTLSHTSHDPISLLRTLRENLGKSGEEELAPLVNEIERLIVLRKSAQPKSNSERNHSRAQRRRAKKLAKRSAG